MATRPMKAIARLHSSKLLLSRVRTPVYGPSIPYCTIHTSARALQAQPVSAGKHSIAFSQGHSTEHIYDVVIVGGGVAGTALACSLGL